MTFTLSFLFSIYALIFLFPLPLSFFFKIFIYLFGCAESQLWQPGSFSFGSSAPQQWHVNSQLWHARGIQFPDQGSNPGPLHWECGVLTTVPPGKSPSSTFFLFFFFYWCIVVLQCCVSFYCTVKYSSLPLCFDFFFF